MTTTLQATLAFMTARKRVIPLICTYPTLTITDVKMPDLVLTNDGATALTPVALEVAGFAGHTQVVSYTPPLARLHDLIRQVNPNIRHLLAENPEALLLWAGEMTIEGSRLCDSEVVPPGQCVILLLSYLLAVHHVGMDALDALEFRVTVDAGGEREIVTLPVPLPHWTSAVRYRFPLRGLVQIGNMAWNYQHHRQALSQEFGFDVTGVVQHAVGEIVTHYGEALTDYVLYRQPIYAAADGVVVAAEDAFPEEATVPPATWTSEASAACLDTLIPQIGRRNAVAGNYLVIQHGPEEYGFYAHLSQHSQRVAVGDAVTAGQEIALVGSTGNSSEPHLHFHLMDGPDIFTANCLPIVFDDIPPSRQNQFYTAADSLASSDTLIVAIPEV
jgi:murein DD-endopeptidase MepM/ murein hydrolase activator NlpD